MCNACNIPISGEKNGLLHKFGKRHLKKMRLDNIVVDQTKEDEGQETQKVDKECQALVLPDSINEELAFSESQRQGILVIPSHGNTLQKLRDIYAVESKEDGKEYQGSCGFKKLLKESDIKVDEGATIVKEILNDETKEEEVDQNVIEGASCGDVVEEEDSPVKQDLHCESQKIVKEVEYQEMVNEVDNQMKIKEVEECTLECEDTYLMGEDQMDEKDKVGIKRKVKKILKNIGKIDVMEKLGKKKKSGRGSSKDIDFGQNED